MVASPTPPMGPIIFKIKGWFDGSGKNKFKPKDKSKRKLQKSSRKKNRG